jgi:hypothetical protein
MLLVSFPIFLASRRIKPRPNLSLLARFRVASMSFRPPAARRRRSFTIPPPCIAHMHPKPPDPRWTTQIRSGCTLLAGAPCTRGPSPPPVRGRARRQIWRRRPRSARLSGQTGLIPVRRGDFAKESLGNFIFTSRPFHQ